MTAQPGEDVLAAALRRESERWLEWLGAQLALRGPAPEDRYAGLWDALEEWFQSEDFHGSFIVTAAAEVWEEPGHSAHAVIAAHRQAVRQLLEDLAKGVGAHDPADLAAQLHVLVEGAISCAAFDRQPAVARTARELSLIALAASTA